MKLLTKFDVDEAYWQCEETPRAKATPKNPYGVAVGQIWTMTDRRRYHYEIVVTAINLRGGYAEVATPNVSAAKNGAYSTRRIRLNRFCPKHHYRLSA